MTRPIFYVSNIMQVLKDKFLFRKEYTEPLVSLNNILKLKFESIQLQVPGKREELFYKKPVQIQTRRMLSGYSLFTTSLSIQYVQSNKNILYQLINKCYDSIFNIHDKNTWQGAYEFFNEAMHQFEEFYEDFEDFIKRAIY